MEMGVGGFVHVGLRPLLEPIRNDRVVFIVGHLAPVEVVACAHLQESVHLFAHQ